MTMIGASLALVAGSLVVATPAQALGSFNVKLTAWGCTEGDYYGQSTRTSSGSEWFIRAITSYTYPICINGTPGARAIGPTSATSWQYNTNSVTVYLSTGLTYPSSGSGQHSVDDDHLRTT